MTMNSPLRPPSLSSLLLCGRWKAIPTWWRWQPATTPVLLPDFTDEYTTLTARHVVAPTAPCVRQGSVRGLDADISSRVAGLTPAVKYLLRPGQPPLFEDALNKLARGDTTDATSAGTGRRSLTTHRNRRRVLMAIINWLSVHNPTLLAKLEDGLQVQSFSASRHPKAKKVGRTGRR
jgi:hypothetical protein